MSRKYLPAYTILEITVVMSVIVVIMGLGISGLVSFKANAEFNSEYTSLVTNIRSIQNRARNSVSEDTEQVAADYYGIFFKDNKYLSYNCQIVRTTLACEETKNLFSNIALSTSTLSVGNCTNVLIQRLSGKLYSTEFSEALNERITTGLASKNSANCQFTLTSTTGDSRTIIFNLNTNQISFE